MTNNYDEFMTIEEQRDIYREETHRWKAALQALEKENAELKSAFKCFKCGDGSTPLYCLNCANDELRQQLAAFRAAMEREKKPDWEKWLKDLADSLETEWDPGKSSCAEAARQLRYMADSFTLKANFVPSELRIKELEQQLETANLCIRGLEGNLAAAEKELERYEKAFRDWLFQHSADSGSNPCGCYSCRVAREALGEQKP